MIVNDTAPRLDLTKRDVTLEVDGQEIHWVRATDPRDDWNKVRVYVSAADFNVLEDLQNRTRRPYDVWRPRVLDVLQKLGYTVCRGPRDCDCGGIRLRWSQKAGCSCPCSPGFIIEDGARYGLRGGGLYIKLTDAPSVDESLPARDLGVIVNADLIINALDPTNGEKS